MRKLLLSIICLIATILANAQAPTFQWVKAINAADKISVYNGKSIAVDAAGNVYTTGDFQGTVDFDPGPGIVNLISDSLKEDVFISKLDAAGNFVWVKQMKGTGSNAGYSIALDASANVYTTGFFAGTVDFDPGAGTDSLNSTAGSGDAFISKLDSSGNFVWARDIGGSASSVYVLGYSIVVDTAGNVYTTGNFYGTADFDPGAGINNLTSTGSSGGDIFISKLDATGNFIWAKQMKGTTGTGVGASITLDVTGNIYTTGYFTGAVDFDPGAGVVSLASTGSYNATFISKLNASGNFVWAKKMAGTDNISGSSLALDAADNVYTTGYFMGTADFDPGTAIVNLTTPNANMFISKLNASGNFVWAKMMGEPSTSITEGFSLVLDAAANVYVTGTFNGSVDFDPGIGIDSLSTASDFNGDVFISKLDASGNFIWAVNMGGASAQVSGSSIALDASDNIYTVGYFTGTADFDPDAGISNLTSLAAADIFILKMSQTNSDGINEFINDDNISIYPNPSNGVFNIAISALTNPAIIEIYNSIGELVYSKQNVISQTTIELNNQANGLYFVKVMSENKIIGMKRIIKE